jgi:hypothetical protein
MKKREGKKTLEEIFEFTEDLIMEQYEVIRTIGCKLQGKGGVREFRLEAINSLGQKLSSVYVYEREGDVWKRNTLAEFKTLGRSNSDDALQATLTYIRQHFGDYSKA